MARYVFSPWMPERKGGKDVAEIISKRTAAWNEERTKKGKETYTYVGWMPEEMAKIVLKDSESVY